MDFHLTHPPPSSDRSQGPRDWGARDTPNKHRSPIPACSGWEDRLRPHTNPTVPSSPVLKSWRSPRAHRQAELQMLLSHKQQISIQGARQRHCGRPQCACAARSVSHLFSSPPHGTFSAEAEPEGPEAEAGRGRSGPAVPRVGTLSLAAAGEAMPTCQALAG